MAYNNGTFNIEHFLVKRSSGSTEGKPTMPTVANMEGGEMAVNFLSGMETIAVKNSDGEIAKFSSDQAFIKDKIGERFADGGDYSGKTVQDALIEDELTFAAAINAVSGAIQDSESAISSKVDVSTYNSFTSATNTSLSNKSDVGHTHSYLPLSGGSMNNGASITAASFVKSGGTSSQFLKADGSVDSSTYVTTSRSISTASGLTGGGNLSANRTLGLAAVGTAGTYYRVVVDAYGRVTSGNTSDANYYATGLTVATATTSNTLTIKGNNSAVKGTGVIGAATSGAAGVMSSADKIKIDGMGMLAFGSCATPAGTAAKVVTLANTNWQLKIGSMVIVKYTNSNSATGCTLNVNGSGAISIYYNNAVFTGSSTTVCGLANCSIEYIYDGTYWVWMGIGYNTNTNYYTSGLTVDTATTSNTITVKGTNSAVKGTGVISAATSTAAGLMSAADKTKIDEMGMVSYGTCATAGDVAAKVVSISNANWQLKVGSIIAVKFTNSNSATGCTLNVNGSGAYPLWYGAAEYTNSGVTVCGSSGTVFTYIFNNTHWVWVGHGSDANTSYSAGAATTATANATNRVWSAAALIGFMDKYYTRKT